MLLKLRPDYSEEHNRFYEKIWNPADYKDKPVPEVKQIVEAKIDPVTAIKEAAQKKDAPKKESQKKEQPKKEKNQQKQKQVEQVPAGQKERSFIMIKPDGM